MVGSEPEAEVAQVITMQKVGNVTCAISDLRRPTSADPVLRRVMIFMRSGWPPESLKESLKLYKQRNEELSIEGGCLIWGLSRCGFRHGREGAPPFRQVSLDYYSSHLC